MDYYGYYFREPSFFGSAFEDSTHLLNDGNPNDGESASSSSQELTKKKFPRSVFFVVGNEFCERFTFYGIRACLSIYLMSQLDMKQSTATAVFHSYLMVCFFTPVFGSMLADGCLGKFRTIFYLSLIYALGIIVLALSATPPLKFPMLPMSMVGLVLIAFGTGGIKPCVSAFGGDQFQNDQVKQRERFFFIFYFFINFGSLFSIFLIPILKDDISCFGMDTCYPLAFGVTAILLIISVIIFIAGRSMYTILPPKDNIILNVSKCIGHAIKRRWEARTATRDHWLDYADDEFDFKFISDVRAVLRVMFLFLPLPLFWALFSQRGSLWTFQAQELDGRLWSSYEIIPEQMQMVNPFFILILVPLFEMGIYPMLAKCNVFTKPLPRMFLGGLLAAIAFVVAGVLQLAIENKYPSDPPVGFADISFIKNGPCSLNIQTLKATPFPLNITLDNETFSSEIWKAHIGTIKEFPLQVTPIVDSQCAGFPVKNINVSTAAGSALTVALVVRNNTLERYQEAKLCEKPAHGSAALRLVYNLEVPGNRIMFKKERSNTNCTFIINQRAGITSDDINGTSKSDYCSTTPGIYYLHLPSGTNGTLVETGTKIHPESGGRYDINIYTIGVKEQDIFVNSYIEVAENDLSMLYQIPQNVIITAGEIMLSISGMEFSYAQAPASMKTVLQAAWLLTGAFGNLIVIIISEAKFFAKYSYEYFLFAGLMVAVMFLFAFMCMGYVYVSIDREGNVIYPEGEEVRRKSTSSMDGESTAPLTGESENDDASVY